MLCWWSTFRFLHVGSHFQMSLHKNKFLHYEFVWLDHFNLIIEQNKCHARSCDLWYPVLNHHKSVQSYKSFFFSFSFKIHIEGVQISEQHPLQRHHAWNKRFKRKGKASVLLYLTLSLLTNICIIWTTVAS